MPGIASTIWGADFFRVRIFMVMFFIYGHLAEIHFSRARFVIFVLSRLFIPHKLPPSAWASSAWASCVALDFIPDEILPPPSVGQKRLAIIAKIEFPQGALMRTQDNGTEHNIVAIFFVANTTSPYSGDYCYKGYWQAKYLIH
jgi:hypothetical protein